MQNRRPPIPVIIILLLAVIGAAVYYFYFRNLTTVNGAITASGTVEAVEVSIAPEISGKISVLKVAEGDSVSAGDTLFILDGTLLNAQRAVAAAALQSAQSALSTAKAAASTAQSQYNLTLFNALNEDQNRRASEWNAGKPTDFNQPEWYFTRDEQLNAFQNQVDAAESSLKEAEENLTYVENNSTSSAFLAQEKRLQDARAAYDIAKITLDRANASADGQELKDEAQSTFDNAKTTLDDAQRQYDFELKTDGASKVLQARAKVRVAQESYDILQDQLRSFQTGTLSPKVIAAQKSLDQANAQVEQAQSAVDQAQANLDLLDAQIQKLTVTAPTNGMIQTRLFEVGEVVNPGSTVLDLADLSDLTITVYVPEDRYGAISLGQKANVAVDTFPGETFSASVISISSKAEFTPRNVQTVEGRKTTVFAIKLKVEDPTGKLKFGMPADVTFQ